MRANRHKFSWKMQKETAAGRRKAALMCTVCVAMGLAQLSLESSSTSVNYKQNIKQSMEGKRNCVAERTQRIDQNRIDFSLLESSEISRAKMRNNERFWSHSHLNQFAKKMIICIEISPVRNLIERWTQTSADETNTDTKVPITIRLQ